MDKDMRDTLGLLNFNYTRKAHETSNHDVHCSNMLATEINYFPENTVHVRNKRIYLRV